MVLARLSASARAAERVDAITSRRDQAAVDPDERRRAADRALAERERLELALENAQVVSPFTPLSTAQPRAFNIV
jgi:hypothetical protein